MTWFHPLFFTVCIYCSILNLSFWEICFIWYFYKLCWYSVHVEPVNHETESGSFYSFFSLWFLFYFDQMKCETCVDSQLMSKVTNALSIHLPNLAPHLLLLHDANFNAAQQLLLNRLILHFPMYRIHSTASVLANYHNQHLWIGFLMRFVLFEIYPFEWRCLLLLALLCSLSTVFGKHAMITMMHQGLTNQPIMKCACLYEVTLYLPGIPCLILKQRIYFLWYSRWGVLMFYQSIFQYS